MLQVFPKLCVTTGVTEGFSISFRVGHRRTFNEDPRAGRNKDDSNFGVLLFVQSFFRGRRSSL